MIVEIRPERPSDIAAIARLTEAAFQNVPHSGHTEHFIVHSLRKHQQLTVSLVAVDENEVVGHVAISPVTISSGVAGWHGLGPVSVWPSRQGQGIGSQLIRAGLAELCHLGANGCVVLGEPAFYGRFGFHADSQLEYPGVPHEYFQALSFAGKLPAGIVRYHEAFDAKE